MLNSAIFANNLGELGALPMGVPVELCFTKLSLGPCWHIKTEISKKKCFLKYNLGPKTVYTELVEMMNKFQWNKAVFIFSHKHDVMLQPNILYLF